jgi:hypothetical protein
MSGCHGSECNQVTCLRVSQQRVLSLRHEPQRYRHRQLQHLSSFFPLQPIDTQPATAMLMKRVYHIYHLTQSLRISSFGRNPSTTHHGTCSTTFEHGIDLHPYLTRNVSQPGSLQATKQATRLPNSAQAPFSARNASAPPRTPTPPFHDVSPCARARRGDAWGVRGRGGPVSIDRSTWAGEGNGLGT